VTNIKCSYTVTFTATAPFNEATYNDLSLDQAVELEETVDGDDVLEMLREGNFRDFNYDIKVEVIN
jgi:hypothetical protein